MVISHRLKRGLLALVVGAVVWTVIYGLAMWLSMWFHDAYERSDFALLTPFELVASLALATVLALLVAAWIFRRPESGEKGGTS